MLPELLLKAEAEAPRRSSLAEFSGEPREPDRPLPLDPDSKGPGAIEFIRWRKFVAVFLGPPGLGCRSCNRSRMRPYRRILRSLRAGHHQLSGGEEVIRTTRPRPTVRCFRRHASDPLERLTGVRSACLMYDRSAARLSISPEQDGATSVEG